MSILEEANIQERIFGWKEKFQSDYHSFLDFLEKQVEEGEQFLIQKKYDYKISPFPPALEKGSIINYCKALASYGYRSSYRGTEFLEFNLSLEKLKEVYKIENDNRAL